MYEIKPSTLLGQESSGEKISEIVPIVDPNTQQLIINLIDSVGGTTNSRTSSEEIIGSNIVTSQGSIEDSLSQTLPQQSLSSRSVLRISPETETNRKLPTQFASTGQDIKYDTPLEEPAPSEEMRDSMQLKPCSAIKGAENLLFSPKGNPNDQQMGSGIEPGTVSVEKSTTPLLFQDITNTQKLRPEIPADASTGRKTSLLVLSETSPTSLQVRSGIPPGTVSRCNYSSPSLLQGTSNGYQRTSGIQLDDSSEDITVQKPSKNSPTVSPERPDIARRIVPVEKSSSTISFKETYNGQQSGIPLDNSSENTNFLISSENASTVPQEKCGMSLGAVSEGKSISSILFKENSNEQLSKPPPDARPERRAESPMSSESAPTVPNIVPDTTSGTVPGEKSSSPIFSQNTSNLQQRTPETPLDDGSEKRTNFPIPSENPPIVPQMRPDMASGTFLAEKSSPSLLFPDEVNGQQRTPEIPSIVKPGSYPNAETYYPMTVSSPLEVSKGGSSKLSSYSIGSEHIPQIITDMMPGTPSRGVPYLQDPSGRQIVIPSIKPISFPNAGTYFPMPGSSLSKISQGGSSKLPLYFQGAVNGPQIVTGMLPEITSSGGSYIGDPSGRQKIIPSMWTPGYYPKTGIYNPMSGSSPFEGSLGGSTLPLFSQGAAKEYYSGSLANGRMPPKSSLKDERFVFLEDTKYRTLLMQKK